MYEITLQITVSFECKYPKYKTLSYAIVYLLLLFPSRIIYNYCYVIIP